MNCRRLWSGALALALCIGLLLFSVCAREKNALFRARLHAKDLLSRRGIFASDELLFARSVKEAVPVLWDAEVQERKRFFNLFGAAEYLTPDDRALCDAGRTLAFFSDASFVYRTPHIPPPQVIQKALSLPMNSGCSEALCPPGLPGAARLLAQGEARGYDLFTCAQGLCAAPFSAAERMTLIYRDEVLVFAFGSLLLSAEGTRENALCGADFLLSSALSGTVEEIFLTRVLHARSLKTRAAIRFSDGRRTALFLPE